ncbi:hypothetical protein PG988_001622 [Apiospora saccharicola]
MADIASIQEDINQYQEQVDFVSAGLKDDPGNAELLALKSELDDALNLLNETLAELKPAKAAPAPKSKAPSPPPAQEKWPRLQREKEAEAGPVNYKVNDTVTAKWVSGDKGFYTARITSITGSSTDPIYIVKFKSYDTIEQLRSKDIRPIAQKRKADEQHAFRSALSHSPPSNPAPGVISAAASINPELAQKNREAAEKPADDAKPKFKKIKATKELEAGKSKWQEFNSKSKFAKGSKTKKDSMFRTPDGVNARVGFTGSGQAMRKDPTRSRHIYQANEELD